jgi:hypothetical protein
MNLGCFEIADGRLNEAPRLGHFEIASMLADFSMASRFANGFATMDEDHLAREIDKVLHVRLPSFAVVEGTIAGKCDDSLCAGYFLGIPILCPTCGGTGNSLCDAHMAAIFASTSGGKGEVRFELMSTWMIMCSDTAASHPSSA